MAGIFLKPHLSIFAEPGRPPSRFSRKITMSDLIDFILERLMLGGEKERRNGCLFAVIGVILLVLVAGDLVMW